jgi:hypothetical protein
MSFHHEQKKAGERDFADESKCAVLGNRSRCDGPDSLCATAQNNNTFWEELLVYFPFTNLSIYFNK